MRSIKKQARIAGLGIASILIAAPVMLVSGCSTPQETSLPEFEHIEGTRLREYASVADLSSMASAIVEAVPTGVTSEKPYPFPTEGGYEAAPTKYVQMKVTRTLSGSVGSAVIDVVTPGAEEGTDRSILNASEQPFLLFLTPAMYDADMPAGGYAVVGGPAGTFLQTSKGKFAKLDSESSRLPDAITPSKVPLPKIVKSERQLLSEGP